MTQTHKYSVCICVDIQENVGVLLFLIVLASLANMTKRIIKQEAKKKNPDRLVDDQNSC